MANPNQSTDEDVKTMVKRLLDSHSKLDEDVRTVLAQHSAHESKITSLTNSIHDLTQQMDKMRRENKRYCSAEFEMATLNEDCLEHIFKFLTPVEWVQVSQVCSSWKTAAQRLWKTISKIECWGDSWSNESVNTVIAAKIVLCAAPHVKVLELSENYDPDKLFKFGAFVCNVKNFSHKKMLELLIKKATEITEFRCQEQLDEKLLARLFEKNKIKIVKARNPYAFYRKIPTGSIEDLDLLIRKVKYMESFEGCFPNLKKLRINMELDHPEVMLSAMLPYVSGLMSLNLIIFNVTPYTLSEKLLRNIFKMKDLEELFINFCESEVNSLDHFVNGLAISCPKLRSVKLLSRNLLNVSNFVHKSNITRSALYSLLSFPNLEKLIVGHVEGFDSISLPEMKKLTDFCIEFKKQSTINIESLCHAVKKMPMLHNLMIAGLMSKEQTLQLVFKMAVFAASQGKNIVVFPYPAGYKNRVRMYDRLKIARKNDIEVEDLSNEQDQTLNMLVANQEHETYVDDIKAFVETNMKHCETFKIAAEDPFVLFTKLCEE